MRINAKRVFIVHGHNLWLRDQVRDYISSLKLQPVILADLPNQGNTVIEKLERAAGTVNFVIVLLTAEDYGAPEGYLHWLHEIEVRGYELLKASAQSVAVNVTEQEAEARSKNLEDMFERLILQVGKARELLTQRARQNVILELGIFISRTGRNRVCVLTDPDVEVPSDISGIATISIIGEWQSNLLKELKAARMV